MSTRFERAISRVVRSYLRQSGTPYEIVFVEGFQAPELQGESYHYETRTGRRIYHPSAYKKVGWSSMVYVGSSLHIVVGAGWVLTCVLEEERLREQRRKLRAATKRMNRVLQGRRILSGGVFVKEVTGYVPDGEKGFASVLGTDGREYHVLTCGEVYLPETRGSKCIGNMGPLE
jgi:hypothetical protein